MELVTIIRTCPEVKKSGDQVYELKTEDGHVFTIFVTDSSTMPKVDEMFFCRICTGESKIISIEKAKKT